MKIKHDDRDLMHELDPTQRQQIQDAVTSLIEDKHLACAGCGTALDPVVVSLYDHEGGWTLGPFWPKQWVSLDCPNCKYQSSVYKLKTACRYNVTFPNSQHNDVSEDHVYGMFPELRGRLNRMFDHFHLRSITLNMKDNHDIVIERVSK